MEQHARGVDNRLDEGSFNPAHEVSRHGFVVSRTRHGEACTADDESKRQRRVHRNDAGKGVDGRRALVHARQPNGRRERWLACVAVVVFFLIFVALPLAEIYALIKVGGWLGVFPTIALLLLVSALGAVLVKREGLRVLKRMQEQVMAGNMPSNEILDGVCLLLAGLLLVVPGFVTDVVGLLLLLPPFRLLLRSGLKRRNGRKLKVVATYNGRIVNDGRVYDVRGTYDNTRAGEPPKEIEP
ncbi:MAG: FxsA family protein [Actinobacteria bacterium]|nr:FxsA family protein [Actinomycetota bacterium]NBP53071.1 FxsA family protein [Actinomycetota bacterium]